MYTHFFLGTPCGCRCPWGQREFWVLINWVKGGFKPPSVGTKKQVWTLYKSSVFLAVAPFLHVPIPLRFISSVGYQTLITVEGIPVFPDVLLCSYVLSPWTCLQVVCDIWNSFPLYFLFSSLQTNTPVLHWPLDHVYLCFFPYNIYCTCSKKQWYSEFKLFKLAITYLGFLVYNMLYAFVNV